MTKRKKDPRIQQVKQLAATLSPMVEDFEIHYNTATDVSVVTFTVLAIAGHESATAEEFELTPEQAFWYLTGAVNSSFWTVNIMQMAEANRRAN